MPARRLGGRIDGTHREGDQESRHGYRRDPTTRAATTSCYGVALLPILLPGP